MPRSRAAVSPHTRPGAAARRRARRARRAGADPRTPQSQAALLAATTAAAVGLLASQIRAGGRRAPAAEPGFRKPPSRKGR